MPKTVSEFWLGSEQSFAQYLEYLKQGSALLSNPAMYTQDDDEDEEDDFITQYEDGVAIISINGPLSSHSSWWTRFLGMVGYPDIRDALVNAAHNVNVDEILLDFDSPGGSASGIEDISNLITKVDKNFKPVTAYTKGTMASAAYWLASATREINSSKLASVGSIGVIATHFDVTKQLEQFGVKATVFRAGEFKALGGPYEELSDTAKEIIQGRLDKLYDAFITQVAMGRNVPESVVREKMAEGREFLGYEALKVGLVDSNMMLDEMVSKIKSRSSRSNVTLEQNSLETTMEADGMARKTKTLDEKTQAAIASGVPVEQALENAPEASAETPAVEPEAKASEETTPVPEASKETAVEGSEAEAPAADTNLVSYLRTELKESQDKAMELTMQNKELNSKLESVNSTHSQFRGIVEDALNVRSIAMNKGKMSTESMSDEVLVQQYKNITEEFNKTFPVGGKCNAVDTEQPKPAYNPAHVRAVKTR